MSRLALRRIAVALGVLAVVFALVPLWLWALVGLSADIGVASAITATACAVGSAAFYGATL